MKVVTLTNKLSRVEITVCCEGIGFYKITNSRQIPNPLSIMTKIFKTVLKEGNKQILKRKLQ